MINFKQASGHVKPTLNASQFQRAIEEHHRFDMITSSPIPEKLNDPFGIGQVMIDFAKRCQENYSFKIKNNICQNN